MKTADKPMNLTGKLLIAMPGLADPRFEHGVVLVCAHGPDGAMGLIVNKPVAGLGFGELLDQMEVPHGASLRPVPVLFGGPVERGRGFVLHPDDQGAAEGRMHVPGGFALTTTRDILESLGQGRGPRRALLALGYAGWGGGQLEGEIARNDWLTVDADPELVFSTPAPAKWTAALARLGVDPLTLSSTAGRA